MKYAWIEQHRLTYSTTMMCELLSVSRSGLNAARKRAPSKRSTEDLALVKQLSEAQGRPVNHKRIGRLMREHGLQSRKRRRFRVVTTDSKHAHPVAPNVLEVKDKGTFGYVDTSLPSTEVAGFMRG